MAARPGSRISFELLMRLGFLASGALLVVFAAFSYLGGLTGANRRPVALLAGLLFADLIALFLVVERHLRERRRIEAALRANENRLRATIENVKDYAIVMLDSAGRIASWNPAAEQMYGHAVAEIVGRHYSKLFPPADAEAGKPDQILAQATQLGVVEDEGSRQRKDGASFWAESVVAAIGNGEGKPQGFVKVSRDVTARRRSEESLRELSGRLVQAQDEERRRISRELHDATSPLLTSLITKLYLVQNRARVLEPVSLRALNDSLRLAEEISDTIRTVASSLHPSLLDQKGLLPTLRVYLSGLARSSGLRIDMWLPEELPPLPESANIALFRVVQDFLLHMLRRPGSHAARVRVVLQDGWVRADVGDEASGISETALEAARRSQGELGAIVAAMRERLRQIDGRLEIQGDTTRTWIVATVPLRAKPPSADVLLAPADTPPPIPS